MKLPIYLHTYFSPFKPLKLKLYFGKTAIGIPWFLPRKWKKFTYEDCVAKAEEHLKKHPKSSELVPFDKLVDSYKGYSKAVPLKVGFTFCGLGWKTKWSNTDYRFEFSPIWSFVFFGYQIALTFYSPYESHYFEPFLFYYYATDKTKSREDRVKECREKFPQTWSSYSEDKKVTTDYYELIIKKKYL